ncbi:MAG: aminopeptidase P N-terminal domain-containing protein [Phycisphaerae bacterium]
MSDSASVAESLSLPFPPDVYRKRRAKLAAALKRPMALLSGHAPARNYEANVFPFRAASPYRYFGGPSIENCALLIEPRSDGEQGCTLFCPPVTADDEVWLGPVPSRTAIAAAAGISGAAIRDADALATVSAGRDIAAICPPQVNALAWRKRLGLADATTDEMLAIIDLRLVKEEAELVAMRRAAAVSCEGQRAALAATRPGRLEADVAAAFHAVLVRRLCAVSFNPIISVRGEILHSHTHGNRLEAGQLLLCDAAAEEPGGYAGDITRTWPVDGRWTPVQRHLYDTVERALNAAVAACTPGRRYREVHDLAARVVCEGLVAAELLRGKPDELAARFAHTLFFTHGVGHLIGLDVHDLEEFGDLAGYAAGRTRRPEFGSKFLRLDRDLSPGYCVTVEPGIYLVPTVWNYDALWRPFAEVVNRPKVDALLRDRFGGIRIEHTVAVRAAGGPEVLTAECPTGADAVAALVGQAGH